MCGSRRRLSGPSSFSYTNLTIIGVFKVSLLYSTGCVVINPKIMILIVKVRSFGYSQMASMKLFIMIITYVFIFSFHHRKSSAHLTGATTMTWFK